jgi:hypothetical protein
MPGRGREVREYGEDIEMDMVMRLSGECEAVSAV